MAGDAGITISPLSADDTESCIRELGALLHACVQDGASISFVLPFTMADGEAFWSRKVLPPVRNGGQIGRAAGRERVGRSVAHGGGRIIKKKKIRKKTHIQIN